MSETSPPSRPYPFGEIGVLPLAQIREMDGLSQLEAVIAGTFPAPPIARTLGFTLRDVEPGRALFAGLPAFEYLNPLGTVHGGWAATLLDSALGCAVHTTLKAGEAYTTVEFKVSLVRPLLPDTGEVVCEGRIVHRGARIATSEASLRGADGKLYAHGSETCMIFPMQRA